MLLPTFMAGSLNVKSPFFYGCVYPRKMLRNTVPLTLTGSKVHSTLKRLFAFGFAVLTLFVVLDVLFCHPFYG